MKENEYKLHYRGSIGWLIFWVIVFFPIALVLLATTSTFKMGKTIYKMNYKGSRGWLCFWILAFFPVAFILLFLNGISVSVHKQI